MPTRKGSYQERMKWFHQARFGMFIHWGLYSLIGRGEWVMLLERIRRNEYARLADRFRPSRFNADAWASLAVKAGMKYITLTTRHHDGFCLFDSQVSDFTSVKTAARRDFVAEYVRACRKAGLKIGFYYSLLDWRFPGYFEHKKYPESAQAMLQQCHDQVRELLTQYGRIDYLFYDGEWVPGLETPRDFNGKILAQDVADFWQSRKLNRMVRKLQPRIIINNRSAVPEDVDTPEQEVTASGSGRGWESCMTMGDSCGWGYIRNNPNMKTVPQMLQHLVTAASGEGNLMLNVGPKADGTIRTEEVRRLRGIGEWMQANRESIHGSQRCELHGGMVGLWTRKGKSGYLHVFRYPGTKVVVPLVGTKVSSALLLATGEKLKVLQEYNGRLVISGLPRRPPHPSVNTIKVRFAAEPKNLREPNQASWLEGKA